jgi:outer membrane protein OmpA-like peptidoglycan-associated protein/ABC-type amino acid transport substrate-binding protein
MKKALSVLLVLATLAMIGWGLYRPWRDAHRAADLFSRTSDARQYKRTITIWGDDWLGYLVLRSPRFAHALADHDIGVNWVMEPDFEKRFAGLRDGKCDFVAATLDSYLTNGNATGWPGAVVFVIDESFGGDAVLAGENIKNLDDLNRPGMRGAFVGLSPSEFLLRAEISHFHLDRLRPGLEKFRVDDVETAYSALRDKRVDFAVLWEPLVTRARNEIPGAHVLIDTREAQGLVIDIALARRQLIDSDPALVQTVTHAYFEALHDYLNNAAALTDAAAHDSGKDPADAETMLRGIRFTTLDDNVQDWLRQSRDQDARLAGSVRSIQAILRDHQQHIELPNDDPDSILYRETIHAVAQNRTGIAPIAAANDAAAGAHRLGAYYPPLTPEQWDAVSRQVRGTLLDEPIVFQPGQTEIPEDFQASIRDAVPKLANYPAFRVVVEAHVSPGVSPAADQALSEARALEVKHFLSEECGVPEDRILARGKGSSEPPERYPGESAPAWERRARRARIFLVGQ